MTFPRTLRVAALVVGLTLVLAGLRPGPALLLDAHASPAPLPADRLHFGVTNGPSSLSWMTGSGVPWHYRYTYLAGGVNTSGNWTTWQDPALPPGQYAVDYMNSSTAPPASYIPVFTWYQLLQSQPSTGADESSRDFSNLNNAGTMNSYYGSFRLLLQRAGSYGRQVVVHVEPDLWGYLQQLSGNTTAGTLSASVASSGFGDVAAYPDTAAGFGRALLHLRDLYAPNVVMALHASAWSSQIDIASSTDASIDATAEADKTAAFLNSAGSWDAVFNDVDDHDAAWWEAQGGQNQWYTHWWDPTNTRFPNFSRYLSWVAELHGRTALPQVVWQVPEGNQYYLTMNNTCGHYQDNIAQYFIGHPNDLFAAGLIAVLFGAGNGCQTTNEDGQGDGVTNNGGATTTDLAGGCNQCNVHASQSTDDDGGYIRIFVGAYYASAAAAFTSYFSWYDRASPGVVADNLHILNPGSQRVTGTASIAGVAYASWTADPGLEAQVSFPAGTVGGPVVIGASARVIASERVQYGSSFNEIPAQTAAVANTRLLFPWYDRISSGGFRADDILLVNPGTVSATASVDVPGQPGCTLSAPVPAGGVATVTCASGFGGKVTVTSDQPLLAAQRVVYFDSFNETWAQPATAAANTVFFPWYDRISSPGFLNDNLHLVNPGPSDAIVTVSVPGNPRCAIGPTTITANTEQILACTTGFGGPVKVAAAGNPVLASQRVQYYQSFNEVAGQRAGAAATTLYFAWFDRLSSPAFLNDNENVHVVNPGPGAATVTVSIPGSPGCTDGPRPIAQGEEWMFTCIGGFGGPVTVTSSGNPVLASQRIQYFDSFNEEPASP